ncbi:CRISPR-associated endonuclease Cas3'' [Pelodictyon phaeoclathratiforme]|jgi:CRISPR-associated endonuclease/helicase Cas3|uniref:HD Cas3-type domain-containing protein n=1 Tax=Pelodictyon phaeoclathratiforme (strain DSM 5477 / BU-1) TaxID=324925 RepID=B4SAU7_PELPB|nr:CRISPR-associated endonuclease Cas3'' [Pelodictyon phaeoclathratiforme]ACF43893.1 conserved hypothetical protein [Pelodictyon phaeoclathratiforme BU-1]
MTQQSVRPVAHLRQNPDGSWMEHDLKEHLTRVAEKAALFADEFSNGVWAKTAGLLHDLGKYNPQWQEYIRKNNGDYTEENHEQD